MRNGVTKGRAMDCIKLLQDQVLTQILSAGRARAPILGMKCTFFRKAIHLVAAKAMRNTCEAFWLIKRIIVTPYAPNLLEAKKPEAPMQQEFKSAEERPLLVSIPSWHTF